MNPSENIVSFDTAKELSQFDFPSEIALGQLRYTMEGETVLVSKYPGGMRFTRRVNGEWSAQHTLPIETKTHFAPNSQDIKADLIPGFQKGNLTPEQRIDEDPEFWADKWINQKGQIEGGGSGFIDPKDIP